MNGHNQDRCVAIAPLSPIDRAPRVTGIMSNFSQQAETPADSPSTGIRDKCFGIRDRKASHLRAAEPEGQEAEYDLHSYQGRRH